MPVKKKTSPSRRLAANGTLPARASRSRGTRKATHEKLLHAAITVLRQGGVAAVSSVSVTRAAGFTQSSFYHHFPNVDACLQEAAGKVALEIRASAAEQRRRSHAAAATDSAAPLTHARLVLQGFLEQRNFAELLLYHRGDRTPIGQAMRQLMADLRFDLVADACALARSLGVPEANAARVALRAEAIFAIVMAAGESLLENPCQDLDLLAAEVAAVTEMIIQGSLGPTGSLRA